MHQQFKAEKKLSEVKKRILELDPQTSDIKELKFLMQNAIEIIPQGHNSSGKITHTFGKDLVILFESTLAKERVDLFKKVQFHCNMDIPDDDIEIEEIPESWSYDYPNYTIFNNP